MTDVISREQLVEEISRGDVVVLEALPPMYYDQEHLPGARNLPLDDLDELAPVLVPDQAAAIVTYCSNAACTNSAIAAQRLQALGYRNVRKYPGGKQEWIGAGLPIESGGATTRR